MSCFSVTTKKHISLLRLVQISFIWKYLENFPIAKYYLYIYVWVNFMEFKKYSSKSVLTFLMHTFLALFSMAYFKWPQIQRIAQFFN